MKKNKLQKNKGFVILFSILISSIILLMASGIYNIVQKQVVLSSYAKQSQKAFYAADAALDCALFYDLSPLLVQTAFPIDVLGAYSTDLTCGGGDTEARLLSGITGTGDDDYPYAYVFRYYGLQENFAGDYIDSGCSYVLVEKKGTLGSLIETRVTAAGFNTCTDSLIQGVYNVPDFDDPTLLERRLSVQYATL